MKSLFFSKWAKIWQILHVIFESTSPFSFKFCINLQYHQNSSPVLFSLKHYILWSKRVHQGGIPLQILHHSLLPWHITPSPPTPLPPSLVNIKLIQFLFWMKVSQESPNFETFEFSGENFLMLFLKAQISFPLNLAQTFYTLVKSSPLKGKFLRLLSSRVKIHWVKITHVNFEVNSSSISSSFFNTITPNSPVNIKLIYFQLLTKESHQSPNFEKHKSVFFQVFYQSWVSSKVTPLYFLSKANIIYTLVKINPLKCKLLRFSNAWVKICWIPHVNFEMTSQFLFKFCIIFHFQNT